jgi:hypothetical protein
VALALLSAFAVAFFFYGGSLLDSGDAEAHLDIARRMVDSRTPGYDQVGTVWLPLPHWLMLPFVCVDAWWRNGIAGAIPSAVCFILGGCFLFAATRRAFQSAAAGFAAAALCALNPNVLYLQSTAMTEPVFFACLAALLYFTVRFRDTQGWPAVAGAGAAACAGTLTRYEGWFLLPFAALYFLLTAERRRLAVTLLFCAIAALGPLFWLSHNWWLSGDALAFYRGPYSPRAIQGAAPYPGQGDWRTALLFFRTAAQLCASNGLALAALGGAVAALFKRAYWPLILLVLPGIFYVWSTHSGATPIFVPSLWYGSYYNTRYGLALLPLFAVAAAGLVALAPARARGVIALLVVLAGIAHWVAYPRSASWIVWQESHINDAARRQAVHEAVDYLAPRYVPGSGIFTTFGAISAIYRQIGIPLRDTFTWDNGLPFDAAVARPQLYLNTQWAVATAGDPVDGAVNRAGCCTLEKSINVKGAPEIRIYRLTGEKKP